MAHDTILFQSEIQDWINKSDEGNDKHLVFGKLI